MVADLAATVPYVSVQKKGLLTNAAEHLGMHHIDFESEDFNRKFRVTALDKESAVKLIDAGMIQWLLSTGAEFAFAVGGCNLLVSCTSSQPPAWCGCSTRRKASPITSRMWSGPSTGVRWQTPTTAGTNNQRAS